MVESMMQTALCRIDVFILSLRFVKLFNVHKVEPHCLSPLRPTFSPRKHLIVEGSIKESLDNVLGKHSSHRCRFLTVRLNSVNFDSCSTSVSSHCKTATWSSFTFLVGLGEMRSAIDATCSLLI